MESNEAFVVGGVATVVGLGSILVGSTRLGNLAMGLCGLAAILLANDPGVLKASWLCVVCPCEEI